MKQVPSENPSALGSIAYELHGNLYLNITNKCTLRCRYCPKFNHTWTVQDYGLRLTAEPGVERLLEAVGDPRRYQQIVFCGLGEPTTRLDTLLGVSRELKRQGAKLRLNTDGLANLIHNRDVTPELADCLDQVSISMNAQNADLYTQHCRPKQAYSYEYMLEFVRRLRGRMEGVTATAIQGLPGVDIEQCKQMAARMRVHFRSRTLGLVG